MATTRQRRAGAIPPAYAIDEDGDRIYTEDDYAAKESDPLPDEWENVGGVLCALGRIIVHQLLEHLLPAGELYIYKSVCVVQIAAIHAEKAFDALVELRLVIVKEEREVY